MAPAELASRFRAFDTICSATQERQDAVLALLDAAAADLAVVIGGYNSSNTCNLARICAERVPTYHIADTGVLAVGHGNPASADWRALHGRRGRSGHHRLAAGRAGDCRADGRGLNPQ